jgi:4-amino-4-deoxy-L-arabinose transferase-like glycosyltransferase
MLKALRFSRLYCSTFVFCGVLALYLCISFATATTALPTSDEALFAIPAYYLVTEGRMINPVVEPTRPDYYGMDRYQFFMPPASFLEIALTIKMVGFSLLAMRLPAILWGLAAVIATRRIVVVATGNAAVAVAAAAVVAIDSSFLVAASNARPDMACFAAGLCGLAVYFSLRCRSLAWALGISNSLVVLGGLSHPNGIVAALVLFAVIIWLDRARLSIGLLAVAASPYVVGALAWGLYIAQAPEVFRSQFLNNLTHVAGSKPLLGHPWLSFLAEVRQRYAPIYGLLPPYTMKSFILALPLVIYLAAGAAMFVSFARQSRTMRLLLVIAGAYLVFITFITPQKRPYYLIDTVPWLAMITGVALYHIWAMRGRWRIVALGLAGVLLTANLVREAAWIRGNGYSRDYVPAARFVLDRSRPNDVVMASREFFIAIGRECRLIDDWWYGAKTGRVADFVILERNDAEFDDVQNPMIDAVRFRAVRHNYAEAFCNARYRVYIRRGLSGANPALAGSAE